MSAKHVDEEQMHEMYKLLLKDSKSNIECLEKQCRESEDLVKKLKAEQDVLSLKYKISKEVASPESKLWKVKLNF